jgi:hypothetical protein
MVPLMLPLVQITTTTIPVALKGCPEAVKKAGLSIRMKSFCLALESYK